MRRKKLKTLSLSLTAAMVLSVANPGVTALAAPEEDSVIEQQMVDESMEQEPADNNVSEDDAMTTETADVVEDDINLEAKETSIKDVISTKSNDGIAADDQEQPVAGGLEDVPEVQAKSLDATALLSTIMKDDVLLQMVVDAYNSSYGANMTVANMTIGDLQNYAESLDFSTDARASQVTSVEGLGAAIKATSIDISSFTGVNEIKNEEFQGCAFETIKLPASITSIGEAAFESCINMKSFYIGTVENTIPSTVTVVGQKAFMSDSALTEISIQTNALGDETTGLFSGCTGLTKITIGSVVTKIPASAFTSAGMGATDGVEVIFETGSQLEKILSNAFKGANLSTDTVDLSNCTNLNGIADGAFRNIDKLATVILPASVPTTVEFGEYVFAKTSLTTLYAQGNETDNVVYLPDYTAASLGAGAFYGNEQITSVSLPGSLTEIPDYAFDGCTSLSSVEQRKTSGTCAVKMIGDCAFRSTAITNTDFLLQMDQLEQIGRQTHEKYDNTGSSSSQAEIQTIPVGGENTNTQYVFDTTDSSAKTYNKKNCGSEVFTNCYALESISIPSSVKIIAQRAFYFAAPYQDKTTKLYVKSNVKSITWSSAANGSAGIERKIYPEAFQNNVAATSLILPENTGEKLWIGASAFDWNIGLTSIQSETGAANTLPSTVSYIGVGAFSYCLSLPEIHIQAVNGEAPTLETQVFESCLSLKKASLPKEVTKIPAHFFGGCPLTEFNFKDMTNVELIDSLAFVGNQFTEVDLSACTKLTELGGGSLAFLDYIDKRTYMSISQNYSIKTCYYGTEDVMQADVEFIELLTGETFDASVFTSHAPVLTKVTLPVVESLYLDTAVFAEQIKMTTMGRTGGVVDGQITIPSYCPCPEKAKFQFGYAGITKVVWEADTQSDATNRWTTLPTYFFEGCANIEKVSDVLPRYIENIGKRAFYGSSIKEADLAGYTTLKVIGSGSVESTDNMSAGVFMACPELTTVTLPTGTQDGISITDYTFKNVVTLTTLDLGDAVSLGREAFYGCTGLTDVDLENVKTVGDYVFQNCTSLATIDFGNVETIGMNAFKTCTALCLTDTPFPDSLLTIGNGAFLEASALGEVTFGSGLTKIDTQAFKQSGVTKLDFSNATALETIGISAFEQATKLTNFEMSGTKVKTIPNSMLKQCLALETVNLGNEVEYVGDDAIAVCPKLKSFSFYASTTISSKVFNSYITDTATQTELITGCNNGASTATNITIAVNVKAPEETVIPVGRDISFPYYVNTEKKSNIKNILVYDNNNKSDTTVEEYFNVRAKVSDYYYKVNNSNAEGDTYKVSDAYFEKLSEMDTLKIDNTRTVDVINVKGLKETEDTRDLKFAITADITFDCSSRKGVTIKSNDFTVTYDVKTVNPGMSATVYTDNKHTETLSDSEVNELQVSFRTRNKQYFYDIQDSVDSGSSPECYNVVVETSNADVLYPGASASAQKADSYTTTATTVRADGTAWTNDMQKMFWLIPTGVGEATITVYPVDLNGEKIAGGEKTYRYSVNSDINTIDLVIPTEYRNNLVVGAEFCIFSSYKNHLGQTCTVEDMSVYNVYTNKPIEFTSSAPEYISVDQNGNIKILKADKAYKNVTITAKSVGVDNTVSKLLNISIKPDQSATTGGNTNNGNTTGGNTNGNNTTGGNTNGSNTNGSNNNNSNTTVKVNQKVSDTTTGSEVVVTKVSNTDLQGEVTYNAPTNTTSTDVVIPDTVTINGVQYKVTNITAGAFKNNKSIKTVKFGKYIKKIDKETFSGCTSLTKVVIGDEIETIDTKAFYNCKKLKTVTISKKSKLKTIGDSAFAKCVKLTKIMLPSKVTTVGAKAFYNCKVLKTITIKSTVLSFVGKQALKNIHKKAKIKVPKKKYAAYKTLLKGKGQKKSVKITK